MSRSALHAVGSDGRQDRSGVAAWADVVLPQSQIRLSGYSAKDGRQLHNLAALPSLFGAQLFARKRETTMLIR
jgi:hypothetical protein